MSASDSNDGFTDACVRSFAFLTERYGFSAPQAYRAGRELVVSYTKGAKSICISIEPGGAPVVEFFYPSLDIKHRSFPKRPTMPLPASLPRHSREWEEADVEQFLQFWALQVESNEREFIG